MKIRLAQSHVYPGHPQTNAEAMLEEINRAIHGGLDLVVFPEMCVPGYLLGDEWERESFLKDCEMAQKKIIESTQGITVIFGGIAVDWTKKNEDGRVRKYNALFVAEDQNLLTPQGSHLPFSIKTLMPNYREFDDNRHFYDPRKLAHELGQSIEQLIAPFKSKHGLLGCILCEDGWDEDYNISPLKILHEKNSDIFINISASPYTFQKNDKRNRVFAEHAKQYKTPIVYVNNVGIQDNGKTIFTFDGASCVYNVLGDRAGYISAFESSHLDVQSHTLRSTKSSASDMSIDNIAQFYQAIRYGTEQVMQRFNIKKVVVGVSGGIDSAVVAAIYRSILKPENLMLVNMPGPYTSQTTINLSRDLAKNLECPYSEIPIEPAVTLTEKQLAEAEFMREGFTNQQLNISSFVLENIQARDRSSRILAGVAAAIGGVFTCNANKSEMTVGYSTLYGDLGGYLANIADLWKGEVYEMARYLNSQVFDEAVIPEGTIKIKPSAELSAQHNVDQNQGDPLIYPYHDQLFKSWVERWNRATPEDILRWYANNELEQHLALDFKIETLFTSSKVFIEDLERWWNLYQGMAVAKRIQAPPVLAVKRRAFGFDHREAQLGPRYTEAYQQLKQSILSP